MKAKLIIASTLAATIYSPISSANDNWYLGALYNVQEISLHKRDFTVAGLIAGYKYNDFFALETRLAKGKSGYTSIYDNPNSPYGSYNEDIDSQLSILIKASYPVFDSVKVYALAGYSKTKLDITGLSQINDANGNITGDYPFKHSEITDGFSYGLGFNYQITEQFNVFMDYQVLPDFEPARYYSNSWQSTTIGVNYAF